ncbi:hypothetical protein CASFOL_020834 [Castilleja foliolosa]|uniref:Strictosidine synthase conserved region domain-containing protein n=1 Tax=Castilleja foliolosa TaxID=1961234 RepID=A0ABD3D6A9_9LAMI
MKSIISSVFWVEIAPILIILLLSLPNNALSEESRNFERIKLPLNIGSEAYAFDSDNIGPYTGLKYGRIVKYNGNRFVDFATTVPNKISQESRDFERIELPANLGSEAYAFDSDNIGPYTGLNDGRIVVYKGPEIGFVDFATTVPNRSKELCDGTNANATLGPKCGRPLDLEFNHKTGQLYIVDLYQGLMVVERGSDVATPVAKGVDGMPGDAPDAIAIDPITGEVYFTDIGTIIFTNPNMSQVLQSGDKSGKLLKYDPKTERRSVVLTGLSGPSGLAVSQDGSFILIAEYLACNITRYWLTGPKAHTSEHLLELPGNPDNIKRTKSGDFWVAVNIQKIYPQLSSFPLGQKISANGQIMQTVNF